MSVLCVGGCHVYLTGHTRYTCGKAANGYPPSMMMYPFPANYAPQRAKASAGQGAAVNIAQFKAAQRAGASHLSADGTMAYTKRMGKFCWANWLEKEGVFGMWWETEAEELPGDAVEM